ncbi:MAG: phosphoribosyl-AMP cyclohydrolase, partial [Pseudomonadota bacterium]
MNNSLKAGLGGVAAVAMAACASTAVADNSVATTAGISEADVVAAQTEWGNGIVAIAAVHTADG